MMTTVTLFSDSLGVNTPRDNDRFCRFLTQSANLAETDIEFVWTDKTSGYRASWCDDFVNYCWNHANWYGKGRFKQAELEKCSRVFARCLVE